MSTLLPVGSVVKLKQDEGKKVRMMVLGFYPAYQGHYYDYLGVPYPSGAMKDGPMHLFNQEDVTEVLFEGYATDESRKALEELTEHTMAVLNETDADAPAAEAAPESPKQEDDLFF